MKMIGALLKAVLMTILLISTPVLVLFILMAIGISMPIIVVIGILLLPGLLIGVISGFRSGRKSRWWNRVYIK